MLELTGLALGVLLGLAFPVAVPAELLPYTGVILLALLSAGLEGCLARRRGEGRPSRLLGAPLAEAAAAVALTWLGEGTGVPLYLAAVVYFGGKMLQNFGKIRAELLTSGGKKDKIKQDIEQDGAPGTK